jgi:hypothetical protein
MRTNFGLPLVIFFFSITLCNVKILAFTPLMEYVDLKLHIGDDVARTMRGKQKFANITNG